MHLTEVAAFRPQRCAVIPYIGAHHPNGFIDTGNEIDGNRIYISLVGLAEMAKLARIIPPVVPDLSDEVQALQARVAELEVERDEFERQLAAVQVLKRAGFTASRKPGRPPKNKKVEASGRN